MRIVLLCATRRGFRFLKRLSELASKHELVVFSFPETSWEPPYLEDIAQLTNKVHGRFFEARQIGQSTLQEFWDTTPVDLMLVVSWRYLIPKAIYERPGLGTFVFHDSLLPAYRGFSPTVWAMLNGENYTGVTMFEITEDVDSGDIVAQKRVGIGRTDTIADVMERVTDAYLDLLEENLLDLLSGTAMRYPQQHECATYTCKRLPEDNLIDWRQPTKDIYNLIRAVTKPYPGAYTFLNRRRLRIWKASLAPTRKSYVGAIPGRVTEFHPGVGAVVLTGDGELLVTRVQLEGDEPRAAEEILNRIDYTLGR